jgi:hypothetical protein
VRCEKFARWAWNVKFAGSTHVILKFHSATSRFRIHHSFRTKQRATQPQETAIGVSIGMRMACLFVCLGDLELSHLKPNATTRLPIGARLSWNMSR